MCKGQHRGDDLFQRMASASDGFTTHRDRPASALEDGTDVPPE